MLGLLLAGLLAPQGAGAGVALRLIDPASGPLPEVRVRGLPARQVFTIGWEIPGFVPGMATFPTGGEGSRFSLGAIPLRKARRFEVRAVSSGGEPVAGLEVILEREGEAPDASAPIREADRFAERTDSFGNALFFLPPGESLRLRVPKIPGYAPLAPRIVPEDTARIELVLKSGPRIAGRVLDADGRPVPGARVRIAHGWDDGFPPPPEGFSLDHFQDRVVGGAPTGAAGRFSAVDPGPAAGPFFVAVETRDGLLFCSDRFSPGEPVVVRLPRLVSWEARFRKAGGEPLGAGFHVQAFPLLGVRQKHPRAFQKEIVAALDPRGRVRLPLLPGPWHVRLQGQGVTWDLPARVGAVSGGAPMEIEVPKKGLSPKSRRKGPEGTLTVEWRGPGGPPTGFLIELRPREAAAGHLLPGDGSASLFFPLDQDQRTRLEGIHPGLYDLYLHPLRALLWSSSFRIPRTRSAGLPSAAALRIAAGENPAIRVGLE